MLYYSDLLAGAGQSHPQDSDADGVGAYMCISGATGLLAVGADTGVVHLYALSTNGNEAAPPVISHLSTILPPNEEQYRVRKSACVPLTSLLFSPCERFLATGNGKGLVVVYEVRRTMYGGVRAALVLSHKDHQDSPVTSLAWSVSSRKLFSGCRGGLVVETEIKVWGQDLMNPFSLASSLFSTFNPSKATIKNDNAPIVQMDTGLTQLYPGSSLVDILIVSSYRSCTLYGFPRPSADPMFSADIASYEDQSSDVELAYGVCIVKPLLPKLSRSTEPVLLSKHTYLAQPDGQLFECTAGGSLLERPRMVSTNTCELTPQQKSFKHLCPVITENDSDDQQIFCAINSANQLVTIDTLNCTYYVHSQYEDVLDVTSCNGFLLVLHGRISSQIDCFYFATSLLARTLHAADIGSTQIKAAVCIQRHWRAHRESNTNNEAIADSNNREDAISNTNTRGINQTLTSSSPCPFSDRLGDMDELLTQSLIHTDEELEDLCFGSTAQDIRTITTTSSIEDQQSVDMGAFEEYAHKKRLNVVNAAIQKADRTLCARRDEVSLNQTRPEVLNEIDHLVDSTRSLVNLDDRDSSRAFSALENLPSLDNRGSLHCPREYTSSNDPGFVSLEQCDNLIAASHEVLADPHCLIEALDTTSETHGPISHDNRVIQAYQYLLPSSVSMTSVMVGVSSVLEQTQKIGAITLNQLGLGPGLVRSNLLNNVDTLEHSGSDTMRLGLPANSKTSPERSVPILQGDTAIPASKFESAVTVSTYFKRLYDHGEEPDTNESHDRSSISSAHRSARNFLTATIDDDPEMRAARDIPPNSFECTLVAPHGIGLNLVIVGRDLVVRAFNLLANGQPGPAYVCGLIEIGDKLVGVNDVNLRSLNLPDTIEVLTNLDRIGEEPIILRFVYKDAAEDEEVEEDDPLMHMFEEMTTPDDVRAVLQQRKLTQQPRPRGSSDRSSSLDRMTIEIEPTQSSHPSSLLGPETELYPNHNLHCTETSADVDLSCNEADELGNVDVQYACRCVWDDPETYRWLHLLGRTCAVDLAQRDQIQHNGWFKVNNPLYPGLKFSRLLRDDTHESSITYRRRKTFSDPKFAIDEHILIPKLRCAYEDWVHSQSCLIAERREKTEYLISVASLSTGVGACCHDDEDDKEPQGFIFKFDALPVQSPQNIASTVDVSTCMPATTVVWDALQITTDEHPCATSSAVADVDIALHTLSSAVISQLQKPAPLGLGPSFSISGNENVPFEGLTIALVDVLKATTSLTVLTTEIDPILQLWLQSFTPAPSHSRHTLRYDVQAARPQASAFHTREYLDTVFDLVTLFFCVHLAWPWLRCQSNPAPTHAGTDDGLLSRVHLTARSNILNLELEWHEANQQAGLPSPSQWREREACDFIKEYGAYIRLDIAGAACSAREMAKALELVLELSISEEAMQAASARLGRTLRQERLGTSTAALPFLEGILGSTSVATEDYDLLACVVLRHLGPLYQRDESLATSVCVLLFPTIRPWNVKRALFGDAPQLLVPLQDVGDGGLDPSMASWLQQARKKYHKYLTQLQLQPNKSSFLTLGPEVVREWLELSLFMAFAEDHELALQSQSTTVASFSSSPVPRPLARSYIVRSRHIIRYQRKYRYRASDAIQACRRFEFIEGMLEVCRQSLLYVLDLDIPSSGSNAHAHSLSSKLPLDFILSIAEVERVTLEALQVCISKTFASQTPPVWVWGDVCTGLRLLWVVSLRKHARTVASEVLLTLMDGVEEEGEVEDVEPHERVRRQVLGWRGGLAADCKAAEAHLTSHLLGLLRPFVADLNPSRDPTSNPQSSTAVPPTYTDTCTKLAGALVSSLGGARALRCIRNTPPILERLDTAFFGHVCE